MAGGRIRHLVIAGLAVGALSGCLDGFGKKTDADPDTAAAAPVAHKSATGDVEAPELFQATDMALWDGRPSLGGVWVASSDVKDPQRVLMRNPANGKSVVGALFRRERENPGPRLQLSSDAATALGLLAGQPGKISVVALKTATVEDSAPVPPAVEPPAKTSPEPAKAETGASVAKATSDALAKSPPVPTATPAKPGAKSAVTAAAIPAPAATKAAPATPAAKAPTAKAPAAAAPAAPAAAGAHIVQIGTFSVEANAKQVSDKLGKAGVATVIRKGQTDGKDHWSVNATGNDKDALLAKVKSLGFADAFIIK